MLGVSSFFLRSLKKPVAAGCGGRPRSQSLSRVIATSRLPTGLPHSGQGIAQVAGEAVGHLAFLIHPPAEVEMLSAFRLQGHLTEDVVATLELAEELVVEILISAESDEFQSSASTGASKRIFSSASAISCLS